MSEIEAILDRLQAVLGDLDALAVADLRSDSTIELAAIQLQFAIDIIQRLRITVN
ncbi:hypothetical protein [Sphingomonas nostoxanthinifaciens]|uniref:hypothetical protein n=1 Tax=Sphingomonas nostoxanthinifaciens TaxID=2872652 RepID=UPI001CC1CBCD|nr:hypothetical protein [Sphingomonas nostoxanthinifaciens]UAK25951.1 hypothetical protein K8P63_07475 [Sphingomonas nostoxanthinifaciens]